MITEFVTATLVLTGSLLVLIAAIGLVRLPDVLCRSHAVAKAMTLGIFLLLFGLWVHLGGQEATLKIVLAICFQVITIPVASHLVGLLALKKGLPRWTGVETQPPPTPDARSS